MINTTIDQKGISLSETELLDLNRGGQMWEKGEVAICQFPLQITSPINTCNLIDYVLKSSIDIIAYIHVKTKERYFSYINPYPFNVNY